MAHFQEKIEEMQKKLNKINDNIEEIKNERIIMEEYKKSRKNNDFLINSIKKKNQLRMKNNNFFNKKNGIKSEYNIMSKNNGNNYCQYQSYFSNINLMNNQNYNIPNNSHFINQKLNLNNDQKYINPFFENSKNETPKFLKNTTNYKNCKISINKDYSNAHLSNNKYINNKKIKKINSASNIMNSIPATRGYKKFKKLLKSNTNKNNEYFTNNKNTIDIDYNYSYNTENINNNKNILINQRNKSSKSLSLENQRMRNRLNKGYNTYNNHIRYRKGSNVIERKNSYNSISTSRTYMIKTKDKYKKILFDIINVTNEYNKFGNKNEINIDNILHAYKLMLYNNQINKEFISRLLNLYNKDHRINLDINNSDSLTNILNWIKFKCDSKKEKENNEYKNLCLNIMKEYNLENIEQLKAFIKKMLKKVNNNDYFLEGIKKILLP